MEDRYINIKEIAKIKGLSSTRSLRLEINKTESKYIAKEVKVNGGTSYEILFSSLEPEIQQKLRNAENKTTALVPLNNNKQAEFVSDKTKMTANYRANIVAALQKLRKKYSTKKEADTVFLDLYNSGLYLPKAYNFIGSISIGTLHRWVRAFEKHESTECLQPKYKWSKQGEYNSILNDEMKNILLTLLLHPSKYNYGKAIKLTKEILIKRGYENLPSDISFKRFAEHFRKNNYAEWVLKREGMKAYHDKVEPYIERDISKIEVGDILVADGHVLNFQVINPFTGKPTRATLVGFLDWKSTALVGYEIMMTENTQCIASALRNAIINLGMIPKVVYQDNGKAFKSRFFQNVDFEEEGFNGVYANLNIHSVFAKPYNARAKVIERFFKEFQKELKPTLQKKGWWGEQIVVDTQGNAEKVQLGSMYRLKTIYAVNMQTSYMTGRYKTQMDNTDNRPYWEYVAVLDSKTRPEHAQLHGLVYRYDDPFWASFYPPNGWRCRCRVNALSNYNLQKKNIKPSDSTGTLSQEMRLVSKKSGEYKPVTVYTDPLTGKKIAPDVGWSHNPASGLNDI